MAYNAKSFYPGGAGERIQRFFVETGGMTAGQLAIRNANAATAGEVEDPTNTGAADMMGVCLDTITYSTTQTDFDGFPQEEEGTVAIIADPFAVIALPVSGGAAGGTALSEASSNLLVNDTADTTGLIITDTAVSTIDMDGGLICGLTGNNVGVIRRNTTHTNSQDNRVLVPFPRTIAVGDRFLRVPYSKSCLTVQLCDTAGAGQFGEADGTIAYGTGAPMRVVDVFFDVIEDAVLIHVLAGDHFYNASA